MPAKKSSGSTAKKESGAKRPARKRAPRKQDAEISTAPSTVVNVAEDRLTGVARTIGSKVGGIVAKTKKVLKRD